MCIHIAEQTFCNFNILIFSFDYDILITQQHLLKFYLNLILNSASKSAVRHVPRDTVSPSTVTTSYTIAWLEMRFLNNDDDTVLSILRKSWLILINSFHFNQSATQSLSRTMILIPIATSVNDTHIRWWESNMKEHKISN